MLSARGPHLIEGAGHLLAEDAPEALIDHLDTFLEDTGAQPAALPPV